MLAKGVERNRQFLIHHVGQKVAGGKFFSPIQILFLKLVKHSLILGMAQGYLVLLSRLIHYFQYEFGGSVKMLLALD